MQTQTDAVRDWYSLGSAAFLVGLLPTALAGVPPGSPEYAARIGLVRDATGTSLTYQVPASSGTVRIYGSDRLEALMSSGNVFFQGPTPVGGSGTYTLPSTLSAGSMFYAVAWDAEVGNPDPDRLVWIRPGTFLMGSPETEEGRDTDEGPGTSVWLVGGFFMRRTEVTQGEYLEVMGSNPSCVSGDARLPVEQVTWDEAVHFAKRLTQTERAAGRVPETFAYRLPTEAEWEYAARAGTTTRFAHGDDPGYAGLGEHAWFVANAEGHPHAVATRLPNGWGLYDMHGNVAEWCLDLYADYAGGRVVEPVASRPGGIPVVRGGSYEDDGEYCRSAFRSYEWVTNRTCALGFRLVLAPIDTVRPVPPIELVTLPPGTFLMGSPQTEADRETDEGPVTRVILRRGFGMGRYEVTQAQYLDLMRTNPSHYAGPPSRPVENVTWFEATEFCVRLTARERAAGRIDADHEYRLPTEAEWEYAARAGTTSRYSFGDDLDYRSLGDHAVFNGAPPVGGGTRSASPWGVFDLYGNVAEWCGDWYAAYAGGELTDPTGPSGGFWRVHRGGSWDDAPRDCRSAARGADFPEDRFGSVGFRVVLAPVVRSEPFAGFDLVRIAAGTFLMGSPESEIGHETDEGPQTRVTFTGDFLIGRYEVTQRQFAQLMGTNTSYHAGLPEQPAESMTWAEAVEFCRRATEFERTAGRLPEGLVYRLPTEAEWEYAARAGSTTIFSYGDDPQALQLGTYAWYLRNGDFAPHAVGRRQPNAWGLYDVHGNVAEWCWDWYGEYPGGAVTDPVGPADGDQHVIRGGSYYEDAEFCRSAFRLVDWHAEAFQNVGFRVVLGRPLESR